MRYILFNFIICKKNGSLFYNMYDMVWRNLVNHENFLRIFAHVLIQVWWGIIHRKNWAPYSEDHMNHIKIDSVHIDD